MLPLILAGAGGLAEIGSGILNSQAQNQINAARTNAIQQENQRQGRWDQQISALQGKELAGYDGIAGTMADRAKTVSDYYKSSGGSLPTTGPTTGVLPPVSNPALAHDGTVQMGKVNNYIGQQGTALGNLRSFGDVMGANARTNAVDNALIGGIDSEKTGSASILQQELNAANNAGNGLKTFADILGGLGKVGVSAGLGGAFGGGAKAAGPMDGSFVPTT